MYKRTVLIQNRTGLHARPATEFINCASKFNSKITIRSLSEEDEVDAKSIMLLLSLAIGQGDEVEISARGDDETEAVDALVALIESKFDED
ncbi:MAG: HPr family phosphocarrier protein [Oscillospiraceae bacterium]|nr:HPr family phosphocarrier protein [Oscillospiraceae bacterium]